MALAILKPVSLAQKIITEIKELNPIKCFIYVILSFLIGRGNLFGYMFPFAMAFFAVMVFTKKKYSIFGIPILLGVFSCQIPNYILFKYVLAFLFFLILTTFLGDKLTKPLFIRSSLSAIFLAIITALYQIFTETILLYDCFLILTEASAVFAFTYIFSMLPDLVDKGFPKRYLTTEEMICVSAVIAIAISASGNIIIYDLRIKYIISVVTILLFSSRGGISTGASVGIIVGMIVTVTSYDTQEAIGIFGVSGIASGLFKNTNRALNCVSWMTSVIVLSFYFNGLSEPSIFIESAIACVIFLLIPKKLINKISDKWNGSIQIHNLNMSYGQKIRKVISSNLKNYSDTFENLAITYGKAYERKEAIEEGDTDEIILKIKARICDHCDFNNICWQEGNIKTKSIMNEIIYRADKGYKMDREAINRKLGFDCEHLDKMIFYTQSIVQLFGISYKWQRKLEGSREITATQFKGIAKSINNLIKEINEEHLFDMELEKQIYIEAKNSNIPVNYVTVIEGKRTHHIVIELEEIKASDCSILEKIVSKELGYPYSITKYNPHNNIDQKSTLIFKKRPKYKVLTSASKYAKEMNVCGDSYICVDLKENEYMIALSDGMGSGERAARESMLTINTLYHLLEAGFEKELALKTMNSMLLLKSAEEIFSTVDITIIDLDSGNASFYKIGAAAAFIKRAHGDVEIIKYSALPIGIMDKIKIEEIETIVHPGDILIMVSDGILDAYEENEKLDWLKDIINEINSKDPQTISDLILNKAINQYGEREKDDMTVIVAKLTK